MTNGLHVGYHSLEMDVIVSDKANLENRAAAKKAALLEDARRLAEGIPAAQIQKENAIAPVGFFSEASISNFDEVIGR